MNCLLLNFDGATRLMKVVSYNTYVAIATYVAVIHEKTSCSCQLRDLS